MDMLLHTGRQKKSVHKHLSRYRKERRNPVMWVSEGTSHTERGSQLPRFRGVRNEGKRRVGVGKT